MNLKQFFKENKSAILMGAIFGTVITNLVKFKIFQIIGYIGWYIGFIIAPYEDVNLMLIIASIVNSIIFILIAMLLQKKLGLNLDRLFRWNK